MEFKANFRFSKEHFLKVVDLFQERLVRRNERGLPLSPLQRLALALAFYSCDAFYRLVGHMLGVKKANCHQILKEVSEVLCEVSGDFIAMPTNEEPKKSADHLQDRFKV